MEHKLKIAAAAITALKRFVVAIPFFDIESVKKYKIREHHCPQTAH
jgi:hypothetical protein